jgi:hypothetical protein
MTTSYIPSTDAGFSAWLLNFSALITATPALYGLIAGDATAIAAQNTAYQAAYTLATNPATRTAPTVAAKDAAKATALAVVRPYAVAISLNAGVDDLDKTAVGVTVRKTVPTPIPAPTVAPQVSFVSAIPLATTLKVVNSDEPTTKAKPFGAIGIEVWASVGTVAATDPAQLKYRYTATKIPTVLSFDAADQGKICTVASRYVTRGGNGGVAKVGPWSALLSFVVL